MTEFIAIEEASLRRNLDVSAFRAFENAMRKMAQSRHHGH